jgi:hypothetical protein
MGQQVVSGAVLMCTKGVAPSTLNVLPMSKVTSGGSPAANIMDNKPMVNVPPFAMCTSPANPLVAAATAAALGVLTPMPCIPVITGPWSPGSSTVSVGSNPAVNNSCKLMCSYGGQISVSVPGQFTVKVP